MNRIEEYEKEIQGASSEHLKKHIGSGVMYLCGKSGMGKTTLATIGRNSSVLFGV